MIPEQVQSCVTDMCIIKFIIFYICYYTGKHAGHLFIFTIPSFFIPYPCIGGNNSMLKCCNYIHWQVLQMFKDNSPCDGGSYFAPAVAPYTVDNAGDQEVFIAGFLHNKAIFIFFPAFALICYPKKILNHFYDVF